MHSDAAVVRRYGEIYAQLRAANQLIGPNDIWVAATALAHGLPLLTRNVTQFRRVLDLRVIDYTLAR